MSETPTMHGPGPGWYQDPQNPGARRYWDGQVWTNHVRTVGMMRWARAGAVAKWVGLGFVVLFVLTIIVSQL